MPTRSVRRASGFVHTDNTTTEERNFLRNRCRPVFNRQFGEGRCTLSMTNMSTAPLPDSSFNPSCSCTAVKSPGKSDVLVLSAGCGVHRNVTS
jgi:hypothetical protein